jgi:hypothetical protein
LALFKKGDESGTTDPLTSVGGLLRESNGQDEVDGLLLRRVKCHDAVVRSRNEESRP